MVMAAPSEGWCPMTDSGTVLCPRCGAEYVASVTTCADCGARLRPRGEPPVGAEDEDEVAYDLGDWTADQREALRAALEGEGVAARFEDDELVVAEADADLAEELI